jgi:steroid delta-isomerase-like uncharacterized protein
MSALENKAVVRRFYEALNKHNVAGMLELLALDWVWHGPLPPGFTPDRAGVTDAMTVYWTAFPDSHATIEDLIAEGDKVVARVTARVTHQGEFMGVPPTGKHVSATGIEIDRIEGGKIVETWHSRDDLGFLQQLGVIPQMAPGSA